jgi:cell division protein FtsW
MARFITHSEESKLSDWYFEIDQKLLGMVLLLTGIGFITMITAGSAEAARLGKDWYYFIKSAFVPYSFGLICLFVISMLDKKQILRLAIVGSIGGIIALLFTFVHPVYINGSARWVNLAGFKFMPADILKPFFIVITAWFLSYMHKLYGSDIFLNREAWRAKWQSWWPYLLVFLICTVIIFRHPDVGTAVLYVGVLFVMLFVAGFPWKFMPAMLGAIGVLAALAITFMPHIRSRAAHIFDIVPRTQAWYSINSIKHGGLFGSGDEAYVKDVLPESINDFVYASIAEDWGAIGACALLLLLFLVLSKLIQHASSAKDDFVVYFLAGATALFGGQICFNLMTALHLFIDKGMTLPFVSYGGVSFITFCVLFGIVLALIREDTWKN